MSKNDKSKIKVVIIGHVHSGKSTLAGHLICKCSRIDKDIIQKYERQYSTIRANYKYSWIISALKMQKQRGITTDVSVSQFQSHKYKFTIIDASAFRSFINNMIAHIFQADCAILVVALPEGQFQSGISKCGQTRQHAYLAFSLGVRKMIICYNKIDQQFVRYSEDRFNQAKNQMQSYLKKMGYHPQNIIQIPISAWTGENMFERSQNTAWYKGPTLVQSLNSIDFQERYCKKPLRISIKEVYKINSNNTVIVVGKIQTGILKQNMTVRFAPFNGKSQVLSIQMNQKQIIQGKAGDIVGFSLRDIQFKNIKKGFICGDAHNDPPKQVQLIKCQVIFINLSRQIQNKHILIICINYTQTPCELVKIQAKLNKISGKVIQQQPKCLQNGDLALIVLQPLKQMSCQSFTEYPPLGKITIKINKQTISFGTIKTLYKIYDQYR